MHMHGLAVKQVVNNMPLGQCLTNFNAKDGTLLVICSNGSFCVKFLFTKKSLNSKFCANWSKTKT